MASGNFHATLALVVVWAVAVAALTPPPPKSYFDETFEALAALKKLSNYSLFSSVANSLGAPISLRGQRFTAFIPINSAVNPVSVTALFAFTARGSAAINAAIFYSEINNTYPFATLSALADRTKLPTLSPGLKLQKTTNIFRQVVLLPEGALLGAAIVTPNIYVGNYVVLHGVDTILIPPTVPAVPQSPPQVGPTPWHTDYYKMVAVVANASDYSISSIMTTFENTKVSWAVGKSVTFLAPRSAGLLASLPALIVSLTNQTRLDGASQYSWINASLPYAALKTNPGKAVNLTTFYNNKPVVKTFTAGILPFTTDSVSFNIPGAILGGITVVTPNLYVGKYITVHGVSGLLVPP